MKKKIVVSITGASGAIYGIRLIEKLIEYDCNVYLVISQGGINVVKYEVDLDYVKQIFSKVAAVYDNDLLSCPLASGTFKYDAFIIAPCSINTIGIIHSNIGNTLIGRIAIVAQKEKRQVIIMPRESPISTLTLKQLYELSLIGVSICYSSPAFYMKPKKIENLVDFMVGKILDLINIKNNIISPWDP